MAKKINLTNSLNYAIYASCCDLCQEGHVLAWVGFVEWSISSWSSVYTTTSI